MVDPLLDLAEFLEGQASFLAVLAAVDLFKQIYAELGHLFGEFIGGIVFFDILASPMSGKTKYGF